MRMLGKWVLSSECSISVSQFKINEIFFTGDETSVAQFENNSVINEELFRLCSCYGWLRPNPESKSHLSWLQNSKQCTELNNSSFVILKDGAYKQLALLEPIGLNLLVLIYLWKMEPIFHIYSLSFGLVAENFLTPSLCKVWISVWQKCGLGLLVSPSEHVTACRDGISNHFIYLYWNELKKICQF